MVDKSFADKFLFTQMTAMAKHAGKTCADGSRDKYALPTTLILLLKFLCIYKQENENVSTQSVKSVRTHRSDFQLTGLGVKGAGKC